MQKPGIPEWRKGKRTITAEGSSPSSGTVPGATIRMTDVLHEMAVRT